MKYFLGYETTDRKIVKIDNNGIVDASTDLFDIVDFTMKFDSLRNLKKSCIQKGCSLMNIFQFIIVLKEKLMIQRPLKKFLIRK